MHCYFDVITSIPPQTGKKRLTLTFDPSFRTQAIRFEFYEDEGKWMVYWVQSVLPMQPVMDRLRQLFPEATWDEVQGKPRTFEALRSLHPVHSHAVDQKTVKTLQKICKNGLVSPSYKPDGLDGLTYEIKVEESSKVYSCKSTLPKEWTILEGLIDFCVACAEVDPALYGARGKRGRVEPEAGRCFRAVEAIFDKKEKSKRQTS